MPELAPVTRAFWPCNTGWTVHVGLTTSGRPLLRVATVIICSPDVGLIAPSPSGEGTRSLEAAIIAGHHVLRCPGCLKDAERSQGMGGVPLHPLYRDCIQRMDRMT